MKILEKIKMCKHQIIINKFVSLEIEINQKTSLAELAKITQLMPKNDIKLTPLLPKPTNKQTNIPKPSRKNPEETELFINLWKNNATIREIREKIPRLTTDQRVYNYAYELRRDQKIDLPRRSMPYINPNTPDTSIWTAEKLARFRELYISGISMDSMADLLETTKKRIRSRIFREINEGRLQKRTSFTKYN